MPKKEEIWGKCMGETPRRISQENLTPRDYFTEKILTAAQEVARKLPDYMQAPQQVYEPLTPTEKQVLQLLAQGLAYQEIAEKLGKKEGSIKFHSSGIFRKLKVKNRQQAVNRAVEIGLL